MSKPAPAVTFRVHEGKIYVTTEFVHKDLCKSVDGARWNPQEKSWVYRADAYTAMQLRENFRGVGRAVADAGFRELLASVPDTAKQEYDDAVKAEQLLRSFSGPLPKTPLWEHQQRAIEKALPRTGYYLAHDMGAGKTLSAIALMLRREHKKILIVCPKRVISTWNTQIFNHTGDAIEVVPLNTGTTVKKVERAKENLKYYEPCAIVVNYETVIQKAFRDWALKQQWDLIVLDEAHRIKAPGGVTSKFLATLGRRADYRLCLSGTPFAHGPLDIYGQFRFLQPDIFGTNFARFKNHYAITNPNFHDQVVEYKDLDDLNRRFYSIADRVMTRDVIDLPEERDEVLYGELSDKARKHYEELETLFWTEIENAPEEPSEVSISNVLTRLMRLQQITSGYVRDDDGVDRILDTTKAELLADLLEDFPLDEPLILFARFVHDLDTIREVMKKAGRTYGEVSGRHDDYGKWQDGEINTLALQLQAGGEGLNDLVRARYCVYYSVNHSLTNYTQSRARIMRPGQKQNCVYFHLVCKDTIDEAVYGALAKRQDVVSNLLKERKEHAHPDSDHPVSEPAVD